MKEHIEITIKDNRGNASNHNVIVSEETAVKCPNCEGTILQQGMTIHKISRLLVGSPNDLYPKIPTLYCVKCHTKIAEPIATPVNKLPVSENVIPLHS